MDIGTGHAWLIPALSVLSSLVISLALLLKSVHVLPKNGSYLSIAAIGSGFLLFFPILRDLLSNGPREYGLPWLLVGGTEIRWSMLLDPLSVTMLGLVTLVALCVQVYSLCYMHGHPRFGWYYAVQSLFAASMLGLVLADNLLLLYITWELVGACSYLLIGFYYEQRSAAEAAKKAFVTTRLGDVGLLIGILLLFKVTGTFQLSGIFDAVATGKLDSATVNWAALLIFLGAMGKSAQFPFHVWLPDAMEGPTPVSALIHAATMVTAGVYLVARTYPIFLAAETVLSFVTIIGLITTLMAALLALVATDIKRVLAYSTVSKLGFMMLALGSGSLAAGIFYLITHGFFKALLFLGSGNVIHATERQDMRELGGLRNSMPVTTATFVIGSLALAGIAPLSGFFSKDEVLIAVREHQSPFVLVLTLFSLFITGVFIARLVLRTFFGAQTHDSSHYHEAGWNMTGPMIVLAALSIVGGLVVFPFFGEMLGLGGGFMEFINPSSGAHGNAGATVHAAQFDTAMALLSTLVSGSGLLIGWIFYGARLWSPQAISKRMTPVVVLLENKYFLDSFYQAIINGVVLVAGLLVATFDRVVVNDVAVNGLGRIAVFAGDRLKYHVTGKLNNYGMGMVVGAVIIAAAAFTFLS
ncbi:MAG: NADH-quinone oxidoreductase subunit L [Dehalococcoidia bacterium]|nr:NADH-quinone oxidoreductase subunit L [Dehalococcoidia bacterium]